MGDHDAAGLIGRAFRGAMAFGTGDDTELDSEKISHDPSPRVGSADRWDLFSSHVATAMYRRA
jgi:hypothetical protein